MSIGIERNKFLYGVFFTQIGTRNNNSNNLPSYFFLDTSIQYKYNDNTTLYTKIHNITNNKFVFFQKGNNTQTDSGRTLYFGLKRFF